MFGRCGSTLSKHLHMEAELTLDKARWLIRQWKAVKELQATLKLPSKEIDVGSQKETIIALVNSVWMEKG